MKPQIQNIQRIREAKNLSRKYVAEKLKLVESNYGKIERGEVGLTLDRLYEIAAILKVQPEEILGYGKSKKGNVTYVPIEAQAGFLLGHTQEHIGEFKTYYLPFITGNNLHMIDASGDSMEPTIRHGDHLVIEQVIDERIIRYGRPHVVVAKDGIVVKRLYQKGNRKFNLVSDNVTYKEYTINKDDVISLWLVRDYRITSLFPKTPQTLDDNAKKKGN